jgi:Cysteine rich repeat
MQYRNAIIASLLTVAFLTTGASAMAQSTPPAQSSAPSAQHPGASPEVKLDRQALRQACAADAKKLCSDTQAGGGKVMQCLRSHRAELSNGCQSAWGQLRADRKATRSQGT